MPRLREWRPGEPCPACGRDVVSYQFSDEDWQIGVHTNWARTQRLTGQRVKVNRCGHIVVLPTTPADPTEWTPVTVYVRLGARRFFADHPYIGFEHVDEQPQMGGGHICRLYVLTDNPTKETHG